MGNTPGELGIREAERQAAQGETSRNQIGIEYLKLEDTAKVWFVTDPGEHSEFGDICFQADLRSIQLQAIGIKGTLPGLTLYMSEEEAKRDAELRLKELQS